MSDHAEWEDREVRWKSICRQHISDSRKPTDRLRPATLSTLAVTWPYIPEVSWESVDGGRRESAGCSEKTRASRWVNRTACLVGLGPVLIIRSCRQTSARAAASYRIFARRVCVCVRLVNGPVNDQCLFERTFSAFRRFFALVIFN